MTLPTPPEKYSTEWANEVKRRFDEMAKNGFRRDRDVELGGGSVIARSPNGTRFTIRVDDDGNLITTQVASTPGPTPSPSPTPPPPPAGNPPVNTVPATVQTVLISGTLVFSTANGNAITVADPDGGQLRTTVSVGFGTLTPTGGSGATVTGSGTDSVSIVGTAAQINAALDGLSYTAPGTATNVAVQVTTEDSSTPPFSDSDPISVAVVAAPPPVGEPPYVPFGDRLDLVNGKYPNGIIVSHKTASEMDASIIAKYNQWRASNIKDDPATPGGKAVKFSDSVLTRSEVMGYGMMMAVIAQDWSLFDQLLRTVRNHPAYSITASAGATVGNALMDWSVYADGSSEGEGWNALDGDLDIAMALLMADRQWGSNSSGWNYLEEARKTISAIKVWNIRSNGTVWSAGESHVSRTSDYMTGHFREFAHASTSTADQALWRDTVMYRCAQLIEMMQQQYSSTGALMPDAIVNTNGTLDPSRGPFPSPGGYLDPHAPDTEGYYAFNGQRNPLRWGTDLMYFNDARWKAILEKLNSWIKTKTGGNPNNVEIWYRLDGTGGGKPWPPRAMVAGFMVGGQVNVQHQAWVNACWDWCEQHWTLEPFSAELMWLSMVVASGNWWNRISGKAAGVPAPAPTPTPSPAPTPAPSGGLPSKIVGLYFLAWRTELNFRNITTDANVLFLFNARFNSDGSLYWEWPGWPSSADVQAVRAQGRKVVLTIGGSGHYWIFGNGGRAATERMRDSIVSLYNQFGGFDGLDLNNFEGHVNGVRRSSMQNVGEIVWLINDLRTRYGANFALTAPPNPNEQADINLCVALANQAGLTYAAPQYYDWVGFNDPGFIRTRHRTWCNALGADKVMVGVTANYPLFSSDGPVGPSLADCTREWDAIEAEFPTTRGIFAFSAQHNVANGNQWSSTMRARVIG